MPKIAPRATPPLPGMVFLNDISAGRMPLPSRPSQSRFCRSRAMRRPTTRMRTSTRCRLASWIASSRELGKSGTTARSTRSGSSRSKTIVLVQLDRQRAPLLGHQAGGSGARPRRAAAERSASFSPGRTRAREPGFPSTRASAELDIVRLLLHQLAPIRARVSGPGSRPAGRPGCRTESAWLRSSPGSPGPLASGARAAPSAAWPERPPRRSARR